MSGTLQVERMLEAPPQVVWDTMTTPEHAQRWLEASQFRARVGHRFTARLPRGPGFDGIVQAEVLEVEAPHLLRLWWSGGPISGEVRLELSPTPGGGTQLSLVQTGFDRERQAVLAPLLTALWNERLTLLQGTVGGLAAGGVAAGVGSTAMFASIAGITALLALLLALLGGWMWLRPLARSSLPSAQTASSSTSGPHPAQPDQPIPTQQTRSTTESQAAPITPSSAVPRRTPLSTPASTSVTEPPGRARSPVFSPDGTQLAFEVDLDGAKGTALYLGRVRGDRLGAPARIHLPEGSRASSALTDPVFHPDGVLVFVGWRWGPPARLYYRAPGISSTAQLLTPEQAPGSLSSPAVTPTGDRVAFISDQQGVEAVYIWDRRDNTTTRVAGSWDVAVSSPTFDASGRRLAWTVSRADGSVIVVADATTGAVLRTLHTPDRDRIRPVFVGDRVLSFGYGSEPGTWDLYLSAGATDRVVARNVHVPWRGGAAVSPDGTLFAWTSADPSLRDRLFFAHTAAPDEPWYVPTPFSDVAEPALTQDEDQVLAAFSALAGRDAENREIFLMRVPQP